MISPPVTQTNEILLAYLVVVILITGIIALRLFCGDGRDSSESTEQGHRRSWKQDGDE